MALGKLPSFAYQGPVARTRMLGILCLVIALILRVFVLGHGGSPEAAGQRGYDLLGFLLGMAITLLTVPPLLARWRARKTGAGPR